MNYRIVMKKNIRTIIALLFLPCLTFTSCDDEVYDFQGDSVNRVYIKPLDNTVNGSNRTKLSVIATPLYVQKETLKLPVSSTIPVKGDVNVSFTIDESLVADYNLQHGTSYQAIPAKAAELKNLELTIPSGKMVSNSVLEISVNDDEVANLSGEYLLPIKIEEVVGNAIASTNRNISYILVDVYRDLDNIWDTPLNENAIGDLLTIDRTGWQVTATNSRFSSIANMLDGNTSTNEEYRVDLLDDNTGFTIDMLQEYSNITGIRQHFYSGTWSITSSDIYTSSDNENWTYQGHFNNNVTVANICFYVPIKARYIKTIVRAHSRYVYIRELNIYIKK